MEIQREKAFIPGSLIEFKNKGRESETDQTERFRARRTRVFEIVREVKRDDGRVVETDAFAVRLRMIDRRRGRLGKEGREEEEEGEEGELHGWSASCPDLMF